MKLELIYQKRNAQKRIPSGSIDGEHFGLFEQERGSLFSQWIGSGKEILELGTRNGSLTRWFSTGNKILGLDIDEVSLSQCSLKEVVTRCVDLNGDWGVQENFYDVVVASEVVEHLYYPDRVLKKIYKTLKPGGILVGSVPNAFNLKNRIRLFLGRKQGTPLSEPTHITQFSYNELKTLLSENFDEVELVPLVQKKWQWFAKIAPGLGSFIIAFKVKKI